MTWRLVRVGVTVALASACAPAEPGWSSGHPADPDAPVGAETPVAAVLREEPAPPPADGGDHHGHHGPSGPEETDEDSTMEQSDAQ